MTQLTINDRIKLEVLINNNQGVVTIAAELGVNRCTVYREIERNSIDRKYYHHAGQKRCDKRKEVKHQ